MRNYKIAANSKKSHSSFFDTAFPGAMRVVVSWSFLLMFFIGNTSKQVVKAITMEQFDQSLEMMRNGCAPKFKVSIDTLDKMRSGDFSNTDKDYMLTKKGEFSFTKALAQIPIILPVELHDPARAALNNCKEIQKNYKESCEKVFYVTKCVADFDQANFKYP